jgi:hypothetical protein
MTGTAEWPYDADRYDDLAKLRIPVIRTPYPDWNYEVALMITAPDDGDPLYGLSLRPGDREVKQVVAYLGYRMEYYNAGWKAEMRRKPLDVDGTTNTVILRKRSDTGWTYRRASWSAGPLMVPAPDGERLTLEQLLDKINDLAPEAWGAWKAAHPEAFGGARR